MMELCVILAVNNLYLEFVGNVLNVLIMIYVPFVIMVISMLCDIGLIVLLLQVVRGMSFNNVFDILYLCSIYMQLFYITFIVLEH